MGKKTAYACIIVLVVVTVAALVLGVYNYRSQGKFSEDKVVVLDGVTQSELDVKLSELVPGDREYYEIRLKGSRGSGFDVKLDFKKAENVDLAKYIDVEIFIDGKLVDSNCLETYLSGKSTTLRVDFADEEVKSLTVLYKMDLEVGDEAQGKSADFKIILTSER